MKKIMVALALSLLFVSPVWAEARIGQAAPAFSVKDINGEDQSLEKYKGKPVVLEWNNPGCPFVKKFYDSANMQKFQTIAKTRGVVWISINSGAPGKQGHMTPAEATAQLAAWKAMPTAYILDPEGKIGRQYGAKTTPHMYVIDKDGVLVYAGAIDDKPGTKAEDVNGAKNYVFTALDALNLGKPVDPATTTAYGCNVKYAD